LRRLFVSPGPIFDPEGHAADWWRFASPMKAPACRPATCCRTALPITSRRRPSWSKARRPAGLRGDPGRHRPDRAAGQCDGGLKPDAYVGTPSFLKIIIEKAQEMGADISSVQRPWSAPKPCRRRCALVP
jgi:phenylacetate-CoA ligase